MRNPSVEWAKPCGRRLSKQDVEFYKKNRMPMMRIGFVEPPFIFGHLYVWTRIGREMQWVEYKMHRM